MPDILHCTACYRVALHCAVPYFTSLYCTLLHCTVLRCIALVLCCPALCCTILHCTVLYEILVHCATTANQTLINLVRKIIRLTACTRTNSRDISYFSVLFSLILSVTFSTKTLFDGNYRLLVMNLSLIVNHQYRLNI